MKKKTKKKDRRPYGQIQCDLEALYKEALDDHEVEFYTFIWDLFGWGQAHRPDMFPEYEEDGSSPELIVKYGPRKIYKKKGKKNGRKSKKI